MFAAMAAKLRHNQFFRRVNLVSLCYVILIFALDTL